MTAVRQSSVSDDLERWFASDGEKTVGDLIDFFGEKTFAVLFVVLMATPALPLPTGGATHVFEIVVVILAAQLVAGRNEIWLPRRWRALSLSGERQTRLAVGLVRMIRRVERLSRPRLRRAFGQRLSNVAFGLLVIGGSLAAFFAPPFSGLDTLPALGVVLLALGVLLEDFAVVVAALVVGAVGIALEILVGSAAVQGLSRLF